MTNTTQATDEREAATVKVIRPYSEHDVYAEYNECKTYDEAECFIATMTPEDNRKMTRQLIDKQCKEKCISVGDTYRRFLQSISEKRSWGCSPTLF